MAYETGVIELHAKIKVRRERMIDGVLKEKLIDTTIGRLIFNQPIPQDLGFVDRSDSDKLFDLEVDFLVGKKQLGKIIDKCIKVHGTARTSEVLDAIKAQGYKYSTRGSITVAVCDAVIPPQKKEYIAQAEESIEKINKLFRRGLISDDERYRLVIETWQKTTDEVTKALQGNLDRYNPIFMEVEEIPADMREKAEKYRAEMVEAIVEHDDDLMEKYLGGEEIPVEDLRRVLRQATIDNELVPVTCGTSYRNKGVQKLLDAIIDYMPAPTDVAAIRGTNPETGDEEDRHSSDSEPFSALAFKIATDPFVGKLCFFRVYSGTVNAGDTVYNSVKDNNERLGRILQMHANHRQDLECVYAGDIAAAVGLKNTTTGDTLCDPKAPVVLESMLSVKGTVELSD